MSSCPSYFAWPRLARLDIPGLLQHVIVRGIEGRDIFNDDHDRQLFVARLVSLLSETGVRMLCMVDFVKSFPSLINANLHPFVTLHAPTSDRICRILQSQKQALRTSLPERYKSIVCECAPYLLELVRYIHLNPLRARMVASLEELDLYPWTGHAVLLGNRQLAGQESAAILERFGKKVGVARQNYRQFIAAGIDAGHREDLVGGGLKRSQGERRKNEYESFDERALGVTLLMDSTGFQSAGEDAAGCEHCGRIENNKQK